MYPFEYREYDRCKYCKHIFWTDDGIPSICPKCGTRLRDRTFENVLINRIETVIAKRRFLIHTWEVKEIVNN